MGAATLLPAQDPRVFNTPSRQKSCDSNVLQRCPQAFHSNCGRPVQAWNRGRRGGHVIPSSMRRLTVLLGLAAWVALASAAQAEDKKGKADAKDAKADASTKAVKTDGPYMELITKGDRAVVARDFDGGIAAYREAIQKDPRNALGHYRVGAAQMLKGDQKEAEAAFVAGLRFVGRDGTLKGKLIFALADLRERQKNNDEAIARWKEYSKNSEENKEAYTYPATATERVARNEAWKKLEAEAAEVKTRIEKRLKEADEAARKSASDPKNK